MNEIFGTAAVALASLAARLLGWRPDEFWTATPAELVTALAPPGERTPLDRTTLEQMLEHDDG